VIAISNVIHIFVILRSLNFFNFEVEQSSTTALMGFATFLAWVSLFEYLMYTKEYGAVPNSIY